jgi:phosphohistidine phosphatase
MKTIYLLRHAKSSWDDSHLADHDRPLAPRGRKAAALVGAYLATQRPLPDLVLCSSATRARQTGDAVTAPLGGSTAPLVQEEIYGADDAGLLTILRGLPEQVETVMLIGHNPAMADLASSLAGDGEDVALVRMGEKFPTGAFARLSFGGSWAELAGGAAYLESFVLPRSLKS